MQSSSNNALRFRLSAEVALCYVNVVAAFVVVVKQNAHPQMEHLGLLPC